MSSTTGGPRPPAKRVPGPRYPLAETKKLFRLALVDKKRATREVANRIGVGDPEAEAFVFAKLKTLTSDKYAHSVEMEWDRTVIADVYGLHDEHGGWYLKFHMDAGRVVVCSCHEPEFDLVCTDKTVLKAKK